MMNICGKSHCNPSTKCGDSASREIVVNGRTMDGKTVNGRPAGWTTGFNIILLPGAQKYSFT